MLWYCLLTKKYVLDASKKIKIEKISHIFDSKSMLNNMNI